MAARKSNQPSIREQVVKEMLDTARAPHMVCTRADRLVVTKAARRFYGAPTENNLAALEQAVSVFADCKPSDEERTRFDLLVDRTVAKRSAPAPEPEPEPIEEVE